MANSFIDAELLASFNSNTLAQQIAAFHKVSFENDEWMKLTFINDEVNEVTATLILVVDGQIEERHDLFGMPCQVYERAAYLATEYAKSNNTNVVTSADKTVDEES